MAIFFDFVLEMAIFFQFCFRNGHFFQFLFFVHHNPGLTYNPNPDPIHIPNSCDCGARITFEKKCQFCLLGFRNPFLKRNSGVPLTGSRYPVSNSHSYMYGNPKVRYSPHLRETTRLTICHSHYSRPRFKDAHVK